MPKITKISDAYPDKNGEFRRKVFIDGEYCCSVRERIYNEAKKHGVSVGEEMTCEQLKAIENNIWKIIYQNSWSEEKKRIDYVIEILSKMDSDFDIQVTGYGANTTELIETKNQNKSGADLLIKDKLTGSNICYIEVTGTKVKRDEGYWIRPDKIEASIRSKIPTIFALCIGEDGNFAVVFIILEDRVYQRTEQKIKNCIEYMVVIDDKAPEIKDNCDIKSFINNLLIKNRESFINGKNAFLGAFFGAFFSNSSGCVISDEDRKKALEMANNLYRIIKKL